MPRNPFHRVRQRVWAAGIVGGLLTVRREFAALIDLALGDRAQRFLVRDGEQLSLALEQREPDYSRQSVRPKFDKSASSVAARLQRALA